MIDPCNQEAKPLLSLKEALERISAAIQPVDGTEKVVLKKALGRVSAQSIQSRIDIPHDRNAAMDGYGLSSKDITPHAFTLQLAGTSWAGHPFQGPLLPGQCIRIFTGAVLPEQADSVVMQEQVQSEGQSIHFPAGTQACQYVRAVGEDINRGDYLLSSPKKLTPIDLGLLASAGIHEIAVKRAVKVAFFSTGDELAAIGQNLKKGQIYDSNRYILAGLLTDPCYRISDLGVIPDNKQELQDRFRQAAEDYDAVITTGGASVGEADFIHEILTSCGQVNFWKIAMKPGKPLAFGKIGNCYFFGLPGNPVSVVATYQQIVDPALIQLAGAPARQALRLRASCTSALKKTPGRQEFQRGILRQNDNGEFLVTSSGKQGSHILGTTSQANCYIVLPADCTGIKAGETVMVEPFSLFI